MGKVFLQYNNAEIQDGFFAQLQRKLSIYQVCKVLNFKYLEVPIIDVTVTQLDDYQNEKRIKSYLKTMNTIYKITSSMSVPNFHVNKKFDVLKPSDIILLKIQSVLFRKNILVSITNPYRILESRFFPTINQYKLSFLPHKNRSEPTIVVHIRRGVTIDHVVPGEKAARALNEEYFIDILNVILNKDESAKNLQLIILTDSPDNSYTYFPVDKDANKWYSEFSSSGSQNGIQIQGHKFEKIVREFPGKTQIIRGGNPQEAVDIMSRAKYLIMSRSSMSYIGAMLNLTGVIYYPPGFWHKPLRNWIQA